MKIHSKRIYTSEGCKDAVLEIENGKIIKITPYRQDEQIDLDYADSRIIPGIIDTHNHGTMGYGLMGKCDDYDSNIKGYLLGLASQGVTSCLPTAEIQFMPSIAKVMKEKPCGAVPLGIHSEGPYLNRVGEKGVDTGHPEIDLSFVEKMIKESDGTLKLFAVAPELKGSKELTHYLVDKGVRVAFAHSNCNYEEAIAAFKEGISVTTHTANVMSGIHHRNMGGLGACLLYDDVYNELICDGLHVSNEMIQLMMRVKNDPYNKIMMISDCTPMSGAPIGKYKMGIGDQALEVNIDERGFCLTDTGRLCGSTVPVLGGIKNLVENLHIPMDTVLKMSSSNPAKVYGAITKGELCVGKDADFVVIDNEYNVVSTVVLGQEVYNEKMKETIFNKAFVKEYKI